MDFDPVDVVSIVYRSQAFHFPRWRTSRLGRGFQKNPHHFRTDQLRYILETIISRLCLPEDKLPPGLLFPAIYNIRIRVHLVPGESCHINLYLWDRRYASRLGRGKIVTSSSHLQFFCAPPAVRL